ncbi:unnamed protein product (macronuclear) [Paramecium tetraurelia]|uniref:Protein kinase-like domain n=1 Tax=Paramecium tetraurelia TaxID=5888 RepID=A0BQR4_PARTE|nr:uncharacterized protein GSPATT00031110001 [Paramecium tetraurelia]CAK60881.1 unnamed protein product [Paramecium tetraurelia]|eukprot:XP_001428279.1 hypothetical protein (macronuclear) [Paramecium tetraurelia strain d4-2]
MSRNIGDFTFNSNECIGQGTLGKLHKGINKKNNQEVVLRLLQKSLLKDDNIMSAALTEEMALMQKLKHPKINPIIEVIESQTFFYVVCPYRQSNLQTIRILQKQRKLPETETIKLINDLIDGFSELIKQGIIHRDLRPSNILYDNGSYIISDPGFVKTIESFKKDNKTKPQQFYYSAPQVLENKAKYSNKCDIWSLGVIVYECLTGVLPFQASSIDEYLKFCRSKKFEIQQGQISGGMKSFIEGCLVYQEEKRFDWTKVLSHPIINAKLQNKNEDIVKDNKKYLMTQIRQKIIKKNLDLQDVYQKIDANHNGLLDFDEFTTFISMIDKKVTKEDCYYIFQQIDKDGSNSISFDEFKLWISSNNTRMAFFKINKPDNLQSKIAQQPKTNNQPLDFGQQKQNQFNQQTPQQQQMNPFQQPVNYQQQQVQQQQQQPIGYQQPQYQQQPIGYQQQQNQFPINTNQPPQQQFFPQPQPQPQLFPQNQMKSSTSIPAGAGFGRSDKLERTILMIRNIIKSKSMDVLSLFQQFDYDKDNFLNFQEFSQLIWSLNGQLTVEEMADLFKVFNLNSDEYISFVEFRLVASMANDKKQNIQQAPMYQPIQYNNNNFQQFPPQPNNQPQNMYQNPYQNPNQPQNPQIKGGNQQPAQNHYPIMNDQYYSPQAQPNNYPFHQIGNNYNKPQKKQSDASQLDILSLKQAKKDKKKMEREDREAKKRQQHSYSPKEEKPKKPVEQPPRPPMLTKQDKQSSILETPKYPTEKIGSQNKIPSPHPSPRQDKRKVEQPTVTYAQPKNQEENQNKPKSPPQSWYQNRYTTDYNYNTIGSKLDQELAESTNIIQNSSIPNFNNKPYRKVLDDKIDKFYYSRR